MSKLSKEERERIRQEWRTSEQQPPADAPVAVTEPFVIERTRAEPTRTSSPPVAGPRFTPTERAARKAERERKSAEQYRPSLNYAPSFEAGYGRSAVMATERSREDGSAPVDFVEAAIRAGMIRPKT